MLNVTSAIIITVIALAYIYAFAAPALGLKKSFLQERIDRVIANNR